jgi:hypothetical protein
MRLGKQFKDMIEAIGRGKKHMIKVQEATERGAKRN